MGENLSNQEIKLQYFIDYWEYFTQIKINEIDQSSYFCGLEYNFINPILYNPKELFKELIDEIETTNLSKNHNKNFFMENIEKLSNIKLKSLGLLETNLSKIQEKIKEKNISDLKQTLENILYEMENIRLGNEYIKELELIISNKYPLDKNNKETIKHLVYFIVFELQNKGFSAKMIQQLITYKQCSIKSIDIYLNKETFPVKFIFQVDGLKHNEYTKIGGIEIYNYWPINRERKRQIPVGYL